MKPTNYGDLIMKSAMDLFADEGLKFFGINKKVKELGPSKTKLNIMGELNGLHS